MVGLAMSQSNITTDQLALLSLKSQIILDPSHFLDESWSPTISVCRWMGLTCGSRHQQVKLLNLSNMSLTVKIPREFGNLSFLVSLDLGSNNFHGNLPQEIAHLHRLKFLDLSVNNFRGKVPSWFGFLHHLQVLNLGNNSFTGSIPFSFFNMSTLEILNLNFNSIEGQIPKVIGSLINLRELRLKGNKLIGSIPLSLSNASRLEALDVSYNSLQGNIPEGIGNLNNMKILSIQVNQLMGSIPFTVFNISRIEVIAFTDNSLSGYLPNGLCNGLPILKGIYLSTNKLRGHMPTSLSNCSHLQILSLSENEFDGPIRSEIGRLSNLQLLFVGENHFTGMLYLMNASTIVSNYLRIAFYYTLTAGIIPQEIGNLVNLGELWMEKNQITGSLPISKFNISLLQILSLPFNNLSGFLPREICNLTKMQHLRINGNKLIVEVFNLQLDAAFKSFDTECEVLRSLCHRNIVKVITRCSNLDFKALVLDYMPNGSLEKYLYSHNYFLDIKQRLSIMIDVACALEYLHHWCSLPVIHCDMKPSNVLLDEDMVAHLSDFGISKLLGEDEGELYTKTLATLGYIVPGGLLTCYFINLLLCFQFLHPVLQEGS
ncbi:hypothetical protein CQW23_21213 [Capsicum baccatum]|uniref:non-specific serine/threonine protein kinase n=1 Tax=Capsicum baccatum TaxID=33114 RepID=A0A2G2VXD1_CAPBA|nr:hypothetical protein CQW23_21213 [Capsicum baccatum]